MEHGITMRFDPLRRGVQVLGTTALAGTLLLAACGGESDDEANASPAASPSATIAPSPTVDLATIDPVEIATASQNLLAQESYRMTVTVNGLPGMEQLAMLFGNQISVELDQVGEDRHVRVGGETGATLLQIWSVGGEVWVDIGTGPTPLEDSLLAGQGLEELLTAPDQILAGLGSASAPEIDWQVTALEEVDGVEAIVQQATFTTEETEASGMSGMIAAPGGATIDATMWVAADDEYLVRMEAEVAAESEDPTASPDTATPGAEGEATNMSILVEVTDVGEIDAIELPDADATPTP